MEIENDGKGKHQSWEANQEIQVFGTHGNVYFTVTSYGETEKECKSNMVQMAKDITLQMNFIKTELTPADY